MSVIFPTLIGSLFLLWQYYSTTGNYGNLAMGVLFILWAVSNGLKEGGCL